MATQYTAGLTTGQVLTAATMNSIGAAWETWTPNFRPETGAWTTTNLVYARYGRLQKFVFGEVHFQITAFGTGGGAAAFDLPIAAKQGNPASLGVGREANLTGQTFNVWRTSTTNGIIRFFNNGAVSGANHHFPFNFFYEAA